MARWIEPFSKPYVGFNFEATAFTAEVMADMDAAGLRQNFMIANRLKEYFSIADAVSVYVNAALQDPSTYVLQRLGGIVRFITPLAGANEGVNPTVAPATTSTAATGGTIPNGVYLSAYTYTGAAGETLLSPTTAITATGTGISTLTLGAAAAVAAPNTGTRWFVSTTNGDVSTMKFAGAGTGGGFITGPTIGSLPASNAAVPPTFNSETLVTISGKYVPMYRLLGAKNVGNTAQRAEIDTTGSGDNDMTGAPGRPKRGGSFTFIPGDTVINGAGRKVTLKNMLEIAAKAGTETVQVYINETRDALQPRDVQYAFIGNTDMQRNLNAAIDEPITTYQASCSDSDPYVFIDYVP